MIVFQCLLIIFVMFVVPLGITKFLRYLFLYGFGKGGNKNDD